MSFFNDFCCPNINRFLKNLHIPTSPPQATFPLLPEFYNHGPTMDSRARAGGGLFCPRLKGLYEPLAYAGFREFVSAAVAFDLFSEHHGGRGRWNSPTRMASRAATLVVARYVSEHRRCLEDGIQKNGRHPQGVPMLSSPAPPAHRPGAFCSVCAHRLRTGCRCVAG
jgi:hypothetical protein